MSVLSIVEVGPRDGLQNEDVVLDVAARVAFVAALVAAAGLGVTLTVAAAFGCPFEGEVSPEHVAEIVRRCAGTGIGEVALADTVGVAVPRDVRDLAGAVRAVTDLPLRCHFHNTRNTGYANALTAIEAGVTALDASSGGIGGCPFAPAATGNIATEDLLYALSRGGIDVGVDMDRLLAASDYVAERLGRPNPALPGRAGMFPAPMTYPADDLPCR